MRGTAARRLRWPCDKEDETREQQLSSLAAVAMFQVVEFEDKAIRILPQNLALSRLEAITQQVEATYVDKARLSSGRVQRGTRG